MSGLVLSTASALVKGYVDILYRGVSRDPSFHVLALPYALIVSTVIFGPWVFLCILLRSLRKLERGTVSLGSRSISEERVERLKQLRRLIYFGCLPIGIVSTMLYVEMFFRDQHQRRAELFIERSIEIVSPSIDETTRLQLRAQFRAIEDAKDFYGLEDRLRQIATERSIKLPEFSSVR